MVIPEDPPEAYEDYFEPDIVNARNSVERLGHKLEMVRHTDKHLSAQDKDEIWQMVLTLTGMSAALSRIEILSRPD